MAKRGSPDRTTDYAKAVVAGKIPAGRYLRLACKRHLDDLKRSRRKAFPYRFDRERAEWYLDFFPQFNHWRGELAGTPFELAPWQVFVAGSIFGWIQKASPTLYRWLTAYVEVPKKSGKTTFAAAIGMIKGFLEGEEGAEVYSIATKRDQARLSWNEAAKIAKKTPYMRTRLEILDGRGNMSDPETSSKFEPLGADKDTADGINPSFVIADEVHRYRDSDLLNTVEKSMAARRNPLTLEITTAGSNRRTICYQHHELSVKVLEGTLEHERWFAFIAAADEEDRENWRDPEVHRYANVGYGVSVKPDFLAAQAKNAEAMPGELNHFLRFHLNLWTDQETRWLSMDRWNACRDALSYAELKGRPCFGGLDLARLHDLCALVLVFPIDPEEEADDEELTVTNEDGELEVVKADPREFHALCWFWMPEENVRKRVEEDGIPYDRWIEDGWITTTPGDTSDHRFIKRDVIRACRDFDVKNIAFDPHNAGNLDTELEEELGELREEDDPVMVKFYQGFGNMAAPTRELERLIAARRWCHGSNPVLTWMAGNATTRENEYGDKKIDKKKSGELVDGLVAGAMAMGALLNYEKTDDHSVSVYDEEDRGLYVF